VLAIIQQKHFLLKNSLLKKVKDRLLADFLFKLANFAAAVTCAILILSVAGMGGVVKTILAGAGISAFVIGFAFRDIGENFLGGYWRQLVQMPSRKQVAVLLFLIISLSITVPSGRHCLSTSSSGIFPVITSFSLLEISICLLLLIIGGFQLPLILCAMSDFVIPEILLRAATITCWVTWLYR
jgi:Mechanosensitive ion channel